MNDPGADTAALVALRQRGNTWAPSRSGGTLASSSGSNAHLVGDPLDGAEPTALSSRDASPVPTYVGGDGGSDSEGSGGGFPTRGRRSSSTNSIGADAAAASAWAERQRQRGQSYSRSRSRSPSPAPLGHSLSGRHLVVNDHLTSLEQKHPQLSAFLRHPSVDERELLPALVDSGVVRPADLSRMPAHEVRDCTVRAWFVLSLIHI